MVVEATQYSMQVVKDFFTRHMGVGLVIGLTTIIRMCELSSLVVLNCVLFKQRLERRFKGLYHINVMCCLKLSIKSSFIKKSNIKAVRKYIFDRNIGLCTGGVKETLKLVAFRCHGGLERENKKKNKLVVYICSILYAAT